MPKKFLFFFFVILSALSLLSLSPYVRAAPGDNPSAEAIGFGCPDKECLTDERAQVDTQTYVKPGNFLQNFYTWMLSSIGIAALFAIVYGGFLYIFSGAVDKTSEAKKWITNAFVGILLAGISYVLLTTINPELVKKFDIAEILSKHTPKK